jgi:hypothetical protein
MPVSSARRALLIDLEKIVGSECYNRNIRNGPLRRDAGRAFRYKVTFGEGKDRRAVETVGPDVSDESLMNGRYAFGANELFIFRALDRVVTYFEQTYRLRPDRRRPYRRRPRRLTP